MPGSNVKDYSSFRQSNNMTTQHYIEDFIRQYDSAKIEDLDREKDADDKTHTMELLVEASNTIMPGLKFTYDLPSEYESNKCPMLDLQVWSEMVREDVVANVLEQEAIVLEREKKVKPKKNKEYSNRNYSEARH